MSLDTLADAFYDELCDVYHAEKQFLKALLKMAKKATDEKLVDALTTHLDADVFDDLWVYFAGPALGALAAAALWRYFLRTKPKRSH